jgi:hypothetical protein
MSSANGVVTEAALSAPLILCTAVVVVVRSIPSVRFRTVSLIFLVCMLTLGTMSLVRGSAKYPYRMTALSSSSPGRWVPVYGSNRLQLATGDYEFVVALRAAARKERFRRGTPLEDFSPFNPGVGLAIGAEPLPTGFLTALSEDPVLLQWTVHQQTKAFRASAWILTSSAGPTLEVASEIIGARPASGYRMAFRGYWPPEQRWFYLYAPLG